VLLYISGGVVLAEGRKKWQAVLNRVTKALAVQKAGNFLTNSGTIQLDRIFVFFAP
jgi:hypothetical protein